MKSAKVTLIIVGILVFGTSICFAAPNPSGYYVLSDYSDETQNNYPWAGLARIYLDGQGNGEYWDLYNSDNDPLEHGYFTYSVAADGQLTLDVGEGEILHGIVSADGSILTLAETDSLEPGMDVGIQESTGMSNGSANGCYRMSGFGDETQNNDPWAELARVCLYGNGNGYYYSDHDPEDNGPFTYSIAADGQLTITAGADVFHGIVSADGSIFNLAETIPGEPGIEVGIKESTGMSNGSANGCYVMSSFGDETNFNSPWAGLARICFNGNGIGTCQDIYTSDNDPESDSFTYSIAADGRLTISVDDDGTQLQFHGIVSADGSIFTLAETIPGEAGIDVGIKKSSQMTVFSTTAGIMNVHLPDDSMNTFVTVMIGNDFSGTLPDDISIAVTGPSGLLPYDKSDYIYNPQFREFTLPIPGSPELGTYHFTVWGDSSTGTATDTQSVNKVLPIPDVNSFSPADGATVASETPTFSWGQVTYPATTIYYQLEIADDQNHVYATGRIAGMLSHQVPEGFLTANKTYRWRVRAVDNSTWVAVQNRSQSNWATFTIRKGIPGIPLLLLDDD